jgi:hypothetical protein
MIVDENYRCGILRDCFAKNFAWMNQRRVEQAARYGDVAFESMLRIEYRDVKFFDRKILQSLSEDFMHVAWTTYWCSFVAILCRHSAAELERGVDCYCTCRSDTGETRQCCNRLRG